VCGARLNKGKLSSGLTDPLRPSRAAIASPSSSTSSVSIAATNASFPAALALSHISGDGELIKLLLTEDLRDGGVRTSSVGVFTAERSAWVGDDMRGELHVLREFDID
jgi:hypothetical protein